jgi:hypothetical protein
MSFEPSPAPLWRCPPLTDLAPPQGLVAPLLDPVRAASGGAMVSKKGSAVRGAGGAMRAD